MQAMHKTNLMDRLAHSLGNAFLLANHGPVVTGKDLVDAVNNMEELEETARLALMLHGHSIRYLSEPEIDELRRMKP